MSDIDVIARIEASVDDGGWRASGSVFNDADKLTWYQYIESWFDLYAGTWEVLPRPALVGHLLPDPFVKTFQTSEAPFNAFTAQEFMNRGEVQGIFFKDVASSPANRHQIIDMSLAKIFYEIFSGHCNLMDASEAANYDNTLWGGAITTVTHPEGFVKLSIDTTNSTEIDIYEVKQGNFFQRLQEIAEIDFYHLWIDKAATLHFEPHPMFGASLPSAVLDIDSGLLAEPLEIETRNDEQIGQVILSGTTPSGLQIYGRYPTDPTAGPIVEKSGYIATADTNMDGIAERMYKYQNRSHSVTAKIGNGIGLLLDLMNRISVTYTSTPDGIAWSTKYFWIEGIIIEILQNFTCRTTLRLEAENA